MLMLVALVMCPAPPAELQLLSTEKQRQAEANRNKAAQKQKALAQQRKAHKAKSKFHEDTFGGGYDDGEDPYLQDQYLDMEDDFSECRALFITACMRACTCR